MAIIDRLKDIFLKEKIPDDLKEFLNTRVSKEMLKGWKNKNLLTEKWKELEGNPEREIIFNYIVNQKDFQTILAGEGVPKENIKVNWSSLWDRYFESQLPSYRTSSFYDERGIIDWSIFEYRVDRPMLGMCPPLIAADARANMANLQEVVSSLVDAYGKYIVAIYLFGSASDWLRMRPEIKDLLALEREYRPSDLDIAIVVDDDVPKYVDSRAMAAEKPFVGTLMTYPKGSLLRRLEEFRIGKRQLGGDFYYFISGIPLYSRGNEAFMLQRAIRETAYRTIGREAFVSMIEEWRQNAVDRRIEKAKKRLAEHHEQLVKEGNIEEAEELKTKLSTIAPEEVPAEVPELNIEDIKNQLIQAVKAHKKELAGYNIEVNIDFGKIQDAYKRAAQGEEVKGVIFGRISEGTISIIDISFTKEESEACMSAGLEIMGNIVCSPEG